jgi:tetratricopeptide (TPR) repeat protein
MLPVESPPTDGNPNHAIELMVRVEGYLSALGTVDNAQVTEYIIELAREAHALTTENSPSRIDACLLLADSLSQRFQRYGDDDLLDEIISLGREALALSSERHPNRGSSCGNLAISLKTRYERTGDVGLLDEAIDLERKALDLHPAEHPNRASSCISLAISLTICYERTGNAGLLDEAIDLQREALDLCPAGNSNRALSCGNLASSLMTRYERTGDAGLLDEAISLKRGALDLCPAGHPDRASSCGNLASSLRTRYERTGDVGLLDEAINLQRETLSLHPAGHPDRSISCGNLAISLETRYLRTGDVGLLDESIGLQREALGLRPAGNPNRASSCNNLASSLTQRYLRTGDGGPLNEAINLQREALDLCPVGHPDRSASCGKLARSLNVRYKRTEDVALLQESLGLFQEAVKTSPVHVIWRHSYWLAWTFIQNTSPFYDVRKAIFYISQSLQHDPDDTLAFVTSLSLLLNSLWQCNTEGKHIPLASIYQRLVNLLPLIIHPALGLLPQLQALKRCTQLGSDAFVNAALANDWSIGLETLELAQGVIWSTYLHRRDPQLKDVPEHLASKLQGLLQSVAMSSAAQPDHNESKPLISPRDILHAQSSRLYAVIREIQALPGLDRFMLGESIDTLRTAASVHPVVVLVGARGHYYALILAASLANGHVVLSLDLSDGDLTSLSCTRGSTRVRRSDISPEETSEEGDRAGLKKTERAPSKPLDGQLQTLWHKVVKPVLAHLGLEVSRRTSLDNKSISDKQHIC